MSAIARSNIGPTFRSLVRIRRLIVLEAGDASPLLRGIAQAGPAGVEIARVINLSERGTAEALTSVLKSEALRSGQIWAVLVTFGAAGRMPADLLLRCRLDGIRVLSEANFWEEEASRIDIDSRDVSWFLCGNGFRSNRLADVRTRLLDLLVGTLLVMLTLPVMLIVALLIKLDSPGPVLYRQERVGLGGRVFTIYKFRSMCCDAEASGRPRWAEIGDPRITAIGRLIRYVRIDELPQLLNVLRGEMSMVGPRPERPYFVEELAAAIPFYTARHYVKPGITGWAQVKASYGSSIEDAREKLRYDLYYIKHRNLRLDLSILFRTIRVVACGIGAR
jgi:exopolysaccharide biosynthesis polyprenyl glycosylphosphotransferase